ncbi:nuclear transport factor 2 family protein [Mongoliitalea daihaiensis]|nr:nuclear transport factor 2 family protein [Mongoliitalea daihaiensis]
MNKDRKNIASDFLRLAALGQARLAFDQYVSGDFRHHNPYFKGDAVSLMQAMDADAKKYPRKVFEILRILEDGDLIAVHSTVQQNPDAEVFVLVHFLRFDGDKIVEVWDIAQEVPAQMVNQFGMV